MIQDSLKDFSEKKSMPTKAHKEEAGSSTSHEDANQDVEPIQSPEVMVPRMPTTSGIQSPLKTVQVGSEVVTSKGKDVSHHNVEATLQSHPLTVSDNVQESERQLSDDQQPPKGQANTSSNHGIQRSIKVATISQKLFATDKDKAKASPEVSDKSDTISPSM